MTTQNDIDAFEEHHEQIVQDALKAQNEINPANTETISLALGSMIGKEAARDQAVRNLKRAMEIDAEEKAAREAQILRDLTELTHLREIVDDQVDEINALKERLQHATESNRDLVKQLNTVGREAEENHDRIYGQGYSVGWRDRQSLEDIADRQASQIWGRTFILGSVTGSVVSTFTMLTLQYLAG